MARIVYPDDDSIWIDLKPVTGRDVAAMQRRQHDDPSAGMMELGIVILAGCLTAWWRDEPINEETLADTPLPVLTWLLERMNATAERTEPEKKASSERSAAGLRRAPTSLAS